MYVLGLGNEPHLFVAVHVATLQNLLVFFQVFTVNDQQFMLVELNLLLERFSSSR
jgi:hypothetical protein